jgi:hypothetical protein
MTEQFDHRSDLLRARDVLWLAIDGNRQLQKAAANGETVAYNEPAAGLIRELRQVTSELAGLGETTAEVSVADQLAAARQARISGAGDSSHSARRSQPRRRGGNNPAS